MQPGTEKVPVLPGLHRGTHLEKPKILIIINILNPKT